MSAIREVSSVSHHMESQETKRTGGTTGQRETKLGQYRELEPEVREIMHEMMHEKSKSISQPAKAADEGLKRQKTDPSGATTHRGSQAGDQKS